MAGAKPIAARAKPTGACQLDNGTSIALAPALSELRAAQNGVEAIAVLENTPEHLHLPVVDAITKGAMYRDDTVRTVLQTIGFPKLSRGFGQTRARNMVNRYL